MKTLRIFLITVFLGLLIMPGKVMAIPFPNPESTLVGDDLDDLGIFIHDSEVIALEIVDVGPLRGVGGAEFGFFFEGSDVSIPANRHTIFEISDQNPDPNGPGSVAPLALVDFVNGDVIDGDESAIQNSFSGSGNIGFYLTPDPRFSFFGIPETLYTDPTLNPGGVDYAATFPLLADPSSLVLQFLFTDPNDGSLDTLAFEVVSGVTPVPEPATLVLLLMGLLPLGRAAFRKNK